MNIKFDVLDIRLTELHTQRIKVPAWETPVLLAIHGENVSQIGDKVIERGVPDARDEFTRLANRYGPKVGDTPYVASVYGNFGPGINALANAIKGAIVKEKAEDAEPVKVAEAPAAGPTVEELAAIKQAELASAMRPEDTADDMSDLLGDANAA